MGLEALPKVQEGSGGPPVGAGGIKRPCNRAGRGQKDLRLGWEGSGVPPGGPGGVGSPLQQGGKVS